jgi:hypothetical protein
MDAGIDSTNPNEKRQYAREQHTGHADPPDDWDGPSSATAQSCAARTAGKLEALKEKFERQANRCQEQERYEAMDVWRDAAVDVSKILEQIE